MRKAIVIKFVQVLLAALALNSVIFYVAASRICFTRWRVLTVF